MFRYFIYIAIAAVAVFFIDDYMNGCKYETDIRIDGKIVIVTGGNTGIGKETVKDLVQRGAKVYVGCRSLERGQAAIDDIQKETEVKEDQMVLLELDLSNFASVREFVAEYRRREYKLDILINSAGVMLHPFELSADGYEMTFATNHLGHFLLTNLLADFLVASAPSRVVTVSSYAHVMGSIDFDDLMSEKKAYFPFYQSAAAYFQSKLANVLFASELARRLEGTGVTSVSLHPGTIKTDLARHSILLRIGIILINPFLKDSYHGARTSLYCALEPGMENHNGKYFDDCGLVEPSSAVKDNQTAKKLWDVSVEMVKLDPFEIHPNLS